MNRFRHCDSVNRPSHGTINVTQPKYLPVLTRIDQLFQRTEKTESHAVSEFYRHGR